MKAPATSLDKIADAAAQTLRLGGIALTTIGSVAKAAGTSPALVHYHFKTKLGLLRAAAERIAWQRTRSRTDPLKGSGLAALDELRAALERSRDDGHERAWRDLVRLAEDDPDLRRVVMHQRTEEHAEIAMRLPALLTSLGAAPAAAPEDLAAIVTATLDGLALGLEAGMPRDALRSAFDAFWLVLIGAGQRASR